MQDISPGGTRTRARPSSLRYLPATLVAGLGLSLLLYKPSLSEWARPTFYGLFLKWKGAPPPSHAAAMVTVGREDGDPSGSWDRPELTQLVKLILKMRPAALALDLPGPMDQPAPGKFPEEADLPPPSGPVVLGFGFRQYRAWFYSEAAAHPFSPLLSRSLYPLLDDASKGLKLPMGEGADPPDSLIQWPNASAGFSGPLTATPSYSLPAFARLGRGVVASLGVEAARRVLRVPRDKVGYVEGLGVLFDNGHLLPMDSRGEMLLRFYRPEDIPIIPAARILEGRVHRREIEGKAIFLGSAPGERPLLATVAGRLSSTEIQATAAANFLDGTTVSAPSWGRILSIALGLAFSGILILAWFAEMGGMATLCLAGLLAALYPAASYWLFLKSSWWLPPELPCLMVLAAYLPFGLTRIGAPRRPEPIPASANPRSHPGPAPRAPVPAAAAEWGNTGVTAGTVPAAAAGPAAQPQAHHPAPIQPAAPAPPKARPVVPRERLGPIPPAAPDPQPAAERPGEKAKPAAQAPQGRHTGTISDEIERDGKGGLVRVGKYRIVRKMGFGSGGDVFEGFDTHMGRKVAIKTITKDAASHFDRAVERFAVEAKAAGSLNHPCINIIYDFGTIRDVSYMVLEFLDGITLSQWMRNTPIPPRPSDVAHWLQQMCSALDYAHAHKVIHRDLKPSNLMVVNEGSTIKLLDFGIAKLEDVGLTQTGMTVGTPSYMSPEQLTGADVGPASDQYGLAVVIYQLLTYKLPYVGTKIPELCNRILKNEIIPITESNPAVSPMFWEALRKAMMKAPEERYPNCLALYQALETTFAVTQEAKGTEGQG